MGYILSSTLIDLVLKAINQLFFEVFFKYLSSTINFFSIRIRIRTPYTWVSAELITCCVVRGSPAALDSAKIAPCAAANRRPSDSDITLTKIFYR